MKFAFVLAALLLSSCETNRFDSDKRQVVAKDAIRRMIEKPNQNFNVWSFSQDTLTDFEDTLLYHPIQYTLHFTYTNAMGKQKFKTGKVVFPSNGLSIISRKITDEQP